MSMKQQDKSNQYTEGSQFGFIPHVIAEYELFWTCSPDWRVLYGASPALERMLGQKVQPENEISLLSFIHDEDRALLNGKIREAQSFESEGAIDYGDVRLYDHDGELKWVAVRGYVTRDDQGSSRLACTAFDISARKQREVEKTTAEKMESMGLLAGGVAHDFNSIMTSVVGHAELLKYLYDEKNHPKLYEYLGQILETGGKGKKLVNQLLMFSRGYEDGKPQIELNTLLIEATELLRPVLPHSIDLSVGQIDKYVVARINPVKMFQVLMNLIVNARDSIEDHGEITIHADHIEGDGTHCYVCGEKIEGRFVAVDVMDSGKGFDEQQLAQLFQDLQSPDFSRRGQPLGLSLVSQIVHESGGHIVVKTHEQEGSSFKVVLQCERVLIDGAWHKAARPVPGDCKQIVVIDGEQSTVRYVSELLKLDGLHIIEETDYERALKYVKNHSSEIDLVIVSTDLGNKEGGRLYEALVNSLTGDKVPILLLSSFDDHLDEQHLVSLKLRHVLRKPIGVRTLKAKVRSMLNISTNEQEEYHFMHEKVCVNGHEPKQGKG